MVALLRRQSLRLLQRCLSLVTLGMQVLQQLLEDRGADQTKESADCDFGRAELAEIGEDHELVHIRPQNWLLQRCLSSVTLGMQVLQQQLEDRGANQEKKHTGRDLEAELAEIGEVLEGVEEERDALQQQVDRLEASAFQSANQAR